MEHQQMIWLSTSLFSNKANWHYILQDGIRPLTENNLLIRAYTIEFNYLSGENIRLALLVKQDGKEEASKNTNAYFTNYFEKANLPTFPVKLPVDGVFMPFSGNAIQYGLYPPVTIEEHELDQYTLPINLSKIIITALQDEIDDETILTFTFYLQISLVKTIYNLLRDEDALFAVVTPADVFAADDNALSNLILMKEITDDVMQTEQFEDELNWLNYWIDDCERALLVRDVTEVDKKTVIKSIYHFRLQAIYRQLGVNAHCRDMLNYFVIKTLQQYFFVCE